VNILLVVIKMNVEDIGNGMEKLNGKSLEYLMLLRKSFDDKVEKGKSWEFGASSIFEK
jgi:hypothetical protein